MLLLTSCKSGVYSCSQASHLATLAVATVFKYTGMTIGTLLNAQNSVRSLRQRQFVLHAALRVGQQRHLPGAQYSRALSTNGTV